MKVITSASTLDLSKMGDADKQNLCSTILSEIEKFFNDPSNLARFEEWQKTHKQKAPVAAGK